MAPFGWMVTSQRVHSDTQMTQNSWFHDLADVFALFFLLQAFQYFFLLYLKRKGRKAKESTIQNKTITDLGPRLVHTTTLGHTWTISQENSPPIFMNLSSCSIETCFEQLKDLKISPGEEGDFASLLVECCCEERIFFENYALLASKLCENQVWRLAFTRSFEELYQSSQQQTKQLRAIRNGAILFGHLFSSNSMDWTCLGVMKLKSNSFSSSRILVKAILQEMIKQRGLTEVKERLFPSDQLDWIFPMDTVRATRHAIQFMTSIGLRALTVDLKERLVHLQGIQKQEISDADSLTEASSVNTYSETTASSADESLYLRLTNTGTAKQDRSYSNHSHSNRSTSSYSSGGSGSASTRHSTHRRLVRQFGVLTNETSPGSPSTSVSSPSSSHHQRQQQQQQESQPLRNKKKKKRQQTRREISSAKPNAILQEEFPDLLRAPRPPSMARTTPDTVYEVEEEYIVSPKINAYSHKNEMEK